MKVSIIAAIAENNVIGKDNALIWRLSDDLKHFKKITLGPPIVMGRKTFESIGKALPGRNNIVISRQKNLYFENCILAYGLQEALEVAQQLEGNEEVFVIGGAEIYLQAVPLVSKVYLTLVKTSPEGDAFLDPALYKDFVEVSKTNFSKNEKNENDFEMITLEKV